LKAKREPTGSEEGLKIASRCIRPKKEAGTDARWDLLRMKERTLHILLFVSINR